MGYHVDSEVGRLRQVIVHRPGTELKRLTPANRHDLLFDDVVWVHRAQEEHDLFARRLREAGVEVLYLTDLLAEVLHEPQARDHLLAVAFDERDHGRAAGDALRAMAESMTTVELADLLVGGTTTREVLDRIEAPHSVTFHVRQPDDFVLTPLPNHLFTRDTSCWVYDGVAVNAMRKAARERESVTYEAIYRWHPRFAAGDFHHWAGGPVDGRATVEGGDVLVLGDGAVLVGMSERTTPQGVERLAARLFAAGSATRVVALAMPRARAFMHLDTVMTMVDVRTFITYAGLEPLPSYTITPGDGPDDLRITDHAPDQMAATIAEAVGGPVRLLTAEQDLHSAAREQWDDGCNALAVAPGLVITYDRTTTSNTYLRDNGIEVLTTPGSELGRGRGGPRCLSCPLWRDVA